MRLAAAAASAVFLAATAVLIADQVSALVCVRPWGNNDRAGAGLVLTEQFGAEEFDGYLIGRAVDVDLGPGGRASAATFAVSVSFGRSLPPSTRLLVGPHGPPTQFEPGQAYFLTLHDTTDPALVPLAVHPCGPAFMLRNAADLSYLLELRDDELIIDRGALAELEATLSPPPEGDSLIAPLAATAVGLGVIAISIFFVVRGQAGLRKADAIHD